MFQFPWTFFRLLYICKKIFIFWFKNEKNLIFLIFLSFLKDFYKIEKMEKDKIGRMIFLRSRKEDTPNLKEIIA
jgi:hypothetical protein